MPSTSSMPVSKICFSVSFLDDVSAQKLRFLTPFSYSKLLTFCQYFYAILGRLLLFFPSRCRIYGIEEVATVTT